MHVPHEYLDQLRMVGGPLCGLIVNRPSQPTLHTIWLDLPRPRSVDIKQQNLRRAHYVEITRRSYEGLPIVPCPTAIVMMNYDP